MAEARASEQRPARRHGFAKLLAFCLLLAAAVGGWVYALGRYSLAPGEIALVSRMGRQVAVVSEPGEHLRWPTPLGRHQVVPRSGERVLRFGVSQEGEEFGGVAPTVMTRDEYVVQLPFVLRYRVDDPVAHHYAIAEPELLLKGVAQAALRRAAVRRDLAELRQGLTAELANDARSRTQRILDACGAGIGLVGLEVEAPEPPAEARSAFDAATAAARRRDRAVAEATRYRSEVIASAEADAFRMREEAQADFDARVYKATGEAEGFRALAAEYVRQPALVRTRLFLETMEQVLPAAQVIVAQPGVTLPPRIAPPVSPPPPEAPPTAGPVGSVAP